MEKILKLIEDHEKVIETLYREISTIENIAKVMTDALKKGNKILLAGNGGSAADSQHFAAEIVVRFQKERKALPAVSLTTDTSILTAAGNDYGFEKVFSRQVEALANEGDVFVCFSTSGNSPNILKAAEAANRAGCKTIGFLGRGGGVIRGLCDIALVVDSPVTARIQEAHALVYHIICELIENDF